jgi:hypothetical protein
VAEAERRIGLMVKGMRVLRYVGPGDDERHLLVEAVDGSEKFSLHITDELRLAAGTDLPRLGNLRESPISPRDIQVRVRAGESPIDIAREADMPLDRVMRFAAAVVQERERITGEARASRARRNTPDGELVVFGEHVDARFTAHGIEPSSVKWDAYRNEDGQWIISASWHGGDLNRVARWSFALAARTVTAMDDTSADLLSDRPIRPVVHVVYEMPIANPSDALTGPIPMPGVREQLFDQESQQAAQRRTSFEPNGYDATPYEPTPFTSPPYEPTPYEPTPYEPTPYEPTPYEPSTFETGGLAALRLLPEALPGMPDAPEPAPHQESDEEHAERARIPSWDDILLGVRRKRD